MLRNFLAFALLLLLVAGCAAPSGTPSVTTATAGPTFIGPPGPSSATSGAPAGGSGWQLISNFPTDGAAQVNAVVASGTGFVAVGTISDDGATCTSDINNGHVWTTTDGQTWVPSAADPFAQTDLTHLVAFNDSVYAFGFTGDFDQEDSPECSPGPNPTGVNIWRSKDGGTNWEHLTQSSAIAHATIGEVVAAGDKLVLVGSQVDAQGNDAAATWSSPDGLTWTPAELPPATSILGSAAAHDNVIVGFGFDSDFPLPWITRDGGGHWYEESVDVAGTEESDQGDVGLSIEDVLATQNGYVAVGDVCCLGCESDRAAHDFDVGRHTVAGRGSGRGLATGHAPAWAAAGRVAGGRCSDVPRRSPGSQRAGWSVMDVARRQGLDAGAAVRRAGRWKRDGHGGRNKRRGRGGHDVPGRANRHRHRRARLVRTVERVRRRHVKLTARHMRASLSTLLFAALVAACTGNPATPTPACHAVAGDTFGNACADHRRRRPIRPRRRAPPTSHCRRIRRCRRPPPPRS